MKSMRGSTGLQVFVAARLGGIVRLQEYPLTPHRVAAEER